MLKFVFSIFVTNVLWPPFGDFYWVIFYVREGNTILNVVKNNDDNNTIYAAMVYSQSGCLGGENLFKSNDKTLVSY